MEFQRFCDNSTQLCLKYWSSLPDKVSKPHIQLFHLFQQYVEFQEAAVIQSNLSTTYENKLMQKFRNANNVEALAHAADAVNCYMHASALYNSAKSRKYLARVLWLLSVDSDEKRRSV
jgi:phosphatidylinositol kinase/protein kinase (PI-3  family)